MKAPPAVARLHPARLSFLPMVWALLSLAAPVARAIPDISLDPFVVGLGNTVTVPNADSLRLLRGGSGTLTNNGNLVLNSGGNFTDLILQGGIITFAGTGTVTLSNNGNNRIYGAATTDSLINSAGHTIQGAGQIGRGITGLRNEGLIVANQSAGLRIDPDAAGMVNLGTLRATNAATLTLENGSFNNAGGRIEAENDSHVDLSAATITGGTLVSSGTGHLHATNNSTLSGVMIDTGAIVELANAERMNLTGTITNAGTIKSLSGGNFTDIVALTDGTTLLGAGSIAMSSNGNNRIYGATSTTTLVQESQHTISGAGQLGANQLQLDNRGTITANLSGGTITIDLSGTGGVNTGTMLGSNGGTLRLAGTTLNNNSGTLRAQNSSKLRFESSTITNGTVDVQTGGTLELDASTFSGGTLDNSGTVKTTAGASTLAGTLTNGASSQIQVGNNTSLTLAAGGTFTNSGTIALQSGGNFTNFIITGGTVSLTGGGTLALSDNANNRIYGVTNTDSLTNTATHTIRGSGQLGVNVLGFTNAGTVIADQVTPLTIDPGTGGVTNTGVFRATNNATLEITAGNYANSSGTMEALAGSTIRFENVTVTGGTLSSTGTGRLLHASASTFSDVTLTAGTTFDINNATVATFGGSLANQGNLKLNSAGNFTDITVVGSGLTLSGGGTITMSNNGNNRITGASGTGGTANLINMDNIIRGAGQIGANFLQFDNRGVVEANISGSTLTIDPSGSGVTNTGTFQAINGGILQLQGGSFNNTNGILRAQTGSTVRLDGATVSGGTVDVASGGAISFSNSTINGGTLSGAGTGVITATGGSNTLGGTVTINSGTQLNLANNTSLQLLASGTYTHNGVMSLGSGGNFTDLIVSGGDVVLGGAGVITLGNNFNNRIYGLAAADRLVLNSGQIVRGGGQVGVGLMGLSNDGLIEATHPTTPLVLDPNSVGVTNSGTLRATGTATLRVTSGTYANSNGLIEAQDGSRVQFENATVSGGTLTSTGSGRLVNAADSTYTGVVLTGASVLDVNNNTSATMSGTFVNHGVVNLNSAGNFTDLVVDSGGLTLSGGGVIVLSDNFNNRIHGSSAAAGVRSLVNQDNTIRGQGQIGVNLLTIDNRALIEANLANRTLQIDTTGGGLINSGTLKAVSGGTLRIESSAVANAGGLISADDASRVDLSAATITGGTLTTAGSGVIRTAGSSTFGGPLTVASGAQISVLNNTSLTLLASGLYTNSGTITLGSLGNFTDLRVSGGDVTLTGGGSVIMGNNSANRIHGSGGTDRLVNSAGHTIQGSGQIGVGLMSVANQGTIRADQSTALVIQPSEDGMTNSGLLLASAGATLRLQSGRFDNNNGLIEAAGAGSMVEFSSAAVANGTLKSGPGALLRHVGSSTFTDVTLATGSAFDIINNTGAHFGGTFINNAVLSLSSAGNSTDFIVNGDLTLDGGGTIALGNNANNRIYGAVSTNKLINRNNTIAGSGNLGVDLLGLVNQATIRANQTTPLVIDPSSAGVTNTGLLRADSGATLQLQNGVFANMGGTIEAFGAGSIVQFSSATVTSGTLHAASGGLLRNAASSIFNDVSITGGATLQIPNATAATFNGTLTSDGIVQLASAGNSTDFLVGSAGVTLLGGAIELGNNSSNRIYSPTNNTTLTNQSAVIRGAGQLGVGLTKIDNRSVIDANLPGATLTVDPNSSGAINTGQMTASNGGILRLKGGTYTNSGGSISAGAGSRVELESAVIEGGAFTAGTIRNTSAGATRLSNLSIQSGTTLEIANATDLTFSGAINNSGTVRLLSAGNSTDLIIAPAGVTLTGNGVIELGDNANNRIYGASATALLQNVSGTIRGGGQLGVNQLTLANSGTIEANHTTPLTVNLANTTPFTNQGTLRASNGANLVFTDNLVNAAIVDVQSGSTFTAQGTYTQSSGGTLLFGGTVAAASHTFQSGGVLQGAGTVVGPVTNSGVITPGASSVGPGIGQLTFNQTLTLTSTSLLHMEIGGLTVHDKIQAPSVTLNGALSLTFANGFQTSILPTDTFTLLSTTNANGLTGMFAGLANGSRIFTSDGFGNFQINYLANGFTLSNFSPIPEPSTYVLLALGGALLLGLRFRRRG